MQTARDGGGWSRPATEYQALGQVASTSEQMGFKVIESKTSRHLDRRISVAPMMDWTDGR
jgi:hypothetical protein